VSKRRCLHEDPGLLLLISDLWLVAYCRKPLKPVSDYRLEVLSNCVHRRHCVRPCVLRSRSWTNFLHRVHKTLDWDWIGFWPIKAKFTKLETSFLSSDWLNSNLISMGASKSQWALAFDWLIFLDLMEYANQIQEFTSAQWAVVLLDAPNLNL